MISILKVFSMLRKAYKVRQALKQQNPSPPATLVTLTDDQVVKLLDKMSADIGQHAGKNRGVHKINIDPETYPHVRKDFAATDFGQGNGCQSFTGLHLDVIQQNDGSWIARCQNWGVFAVGQTSDQAIAFLWAYLRQRHPMFVLPEHIEQRGD